MDKEVCLLPFMGSQELNMTEELNWTEVVEYIVRLLSFFSFGFLWFCSDGQDFCFSLEDIPLWMQSYKSEFQSHLSNVLL